MFDSFTRDCLKKKNNNKERHHAHTAEDDEPPTKRTGGDSEDSLSDLKNMFWFQLSQVLFHMEATIRL